MALADILYSKPYHIAEMVSQYGTGGNWDGNTTTAEADITTEKAAFIADMETAVNATSLSGGDKTALILAITAALEAHIIDAPVANVNIATVLQLVKDNFDTLIEGEGYTYACPECSTTGQITQYDSDGADLGIKIESGLCSGFGFTTVQYRRHPTQVGFIQV